MGDFNLVCLLLEVKGETVYFKIYKKKKKEKNSV